jgi:YD repeat-containing protein
VREYNGGTLYANTTYAYDLLGNLGSVTDHAGNVTGMSYDNFGRKVSMNDPDMGAWSYTYDAAGNLTEQLDANQKRLCFTYDKLDRLTNKWYDSDNYPWLRYPVGLLRLLQ